nr:MAG TPA: hypothetical protein [Caudoviricetes sp.]
MNLLVKFWREVPIFSASSVVVILRRFKTIFIFSPIEIGIKSLPFYNDNTLNSF